MVLQYEAKFTKLARFASNVMSYDVRNAKKFQGERPSIRTRMVALQLKAYFDVVGMVKVVEKECEDYQKIQDQNKKRSKPEESQKENENDKPFKKKTTIELEPKVV